MKTNKMLPDSSISKVWENFRKMKGVVVSLPVDDWVAAEDGTFTNTIYYDGFTSDEILEIDLYNDGNLTETHISEYDGYITEFDITDGALVVTATTKPTVDIDVICRGAIVGEKVIINGSGSGGGSIKIRKMKQADYDKLPLEEQKSGHYIITDAPGLTAKTLEYDDSETQLGVNNVQDAIVEQNKNIEWKLIDTKGYSENINVPSNANEVFVKAFSSTGEVTTIQFPKMAMSDGIWNLGGGVVNAIPDGACYATINVTTSTISLRLFYIQGVKVNSGQISVYYR